MLANVAGSFSKSKKFAKMKIMFVCVVCVHLVRFLFSSLGLVRLSPLGTSATN
jgi:hypothetical protein